MRTIRAQQAAEQFGEYALVAHDGEKILVTLAREPWVMLAPPVLPMASQTNAAKAEFKDVWTDNGNRRLVVFHLGSFREPEIGMLRE